MEMRQIPSTGESLPVIGLGTYRGFDVGSNPSQRSALTEVLRALFATGGSVIDSSPMYGRAEGVAGDLLAGLQAQEQAFVATKVWTQGRSAGISQMNDSLRLLRRLRIDLMQIHNLVDWRTHLPTLRKWKEEGRIRYLGITHYSSSAYGEMEKIMRSEPIDFIQVNYSLDEREAEQRVLPLAAEKQIAALVNLPFGQGRLLQDMRGKPIPNWLKEAGCETWSQAFLKFALAHKSVTCVIPGTGNPQHMAENCSAGEGPALDRPLVKKLISLWDSGLR